MTKLEVVMINFIILILFKVQATDLAPSSFHPSSIPSSLLIPFELDNVPEPVYSCLPERYESCWHRMRQSMLDFQLFVKCIPDSFDHCLATHVNYRFDPVYETAKKG